MPCSYGIGTNRAVISFRAQWGHCNIEEKEASEGSNVAVDIDDVMDLWSKDKLQPTLIAEDFVKAAEEIVPSISFADLELFENLQMQFSSWQYNSWSLFCPHIPILTLDAIDSTLDDIDQAQE